MTSPLYQDPRRTEIELAITRRINRHPDFLSDVTARSPRAVGDAIQDIVSTGFQDILGADCRKYSTDFARRVMADLAVTDRAGLHHAIDVKTHRADSRFSMTNLTSVERLAHFYANDTNFFALLLIRYGIEGRRPVVTETTFVPIEFLAWDCLTIGALGRGQIQIRDSNTVTVNPGYSRRRWMLEFCDAMLSFYPREIAKIGERVSRFEEVRAIWQQRADQP